MRGCPWVGALQVNELPYVLTDTRIVHLPRSHSGKKSVMQDARPVSARLLGEHAPTALGLNGARQGIHPCAALAAPCTGGKPPDVPQAQIAPPPRSGLCSPRAGGGPAMRSPDRPPDPPPGPPGLRQPPEPTQRQLKWKGGQLSGGGLGGGGEALEDLKALEEALRTGSAHRASTTASAPLLPTPLRRATPQALYPVTAPDPRSRKPCLSTCDSTYPETYSESSTRAWHWITSLTPLTA